jgi:hypothetical protein
MVEILMVLALIALITAMVAAGITRVFSDDHPTPDDVFWQACRSAEKLATLGEREVSLGFDAKGRKFVWSDGRDTGEATLDPTGGDVSVQFLQAQAGGSLILIAGQVVETQEVRRVTFYPDGTCSAFRVQFRAGDKTWKLAIDPWTCAPVLPKTEERK